MRTILITGSAGFLGTALRTAFAEQGDHVTGLDLHHAEITADLNAMDYDALPLFDVVICNARAGTWQGHYELGLHAKQAIVNIASIYGVLGSDPALYDGTEVPMTHPAYVAEKGAMVALTRHQATTMAPVRSNAVCPGGIANGHSEAFRRAYSAKVPLGRMATLGEVVAPVVWLAGPGAAYVTGTILMVDGGLHARV